MTSAYRDYQYDSPEPAHTAAYLLDPLFALGEDAGGIRAGVRVLDVGCGNGYIAGQFLQRGCVVVGIDLSKPGIDIARRQYPDARFEVLPADAHLLQNLGEEPFDLVISTEVIEHLYDPRSYVAGCFNACKQGGRFICSTPYHGYLKNMALAITNKFDGHFTALWDGGHIKFWSRQTLGLLLQESGFVNIQFRGAGRVSYLWMSMVMSGDRPRVETLAS